MAANTFLPRFVSDSRLHWGFAIALLAAVAVRFLIRRTTLGYEIRGVGTNVVAARYKGIKVGTVTLAVMAISGAPGRSRRRGGSCWASTTACSWTSRKASGSPGSSSRWSPASIPWE